MNDSQHPSSNRTLRISHYTIFYGDYAMLNQPKNNPARPPGKPDSVPASNIRARADDAQYQRELKQIEREYNRDYD